MKHADLIATAEARKADGMERAATARDRRRLILETQRDLLRAILRAPNGRATLDDATPREDLMKPFPDLGKWRGAAVADLAREGTIVKTGDAVRAKRPSSHRSWVVVWRAGKGKRALRARLNVIEARITELTEE